MSKKSRSKLSAFNGLSIESMSVDQSGDLEVEFDLPVEQTTDQWQTSLKGSRTFDVYDDKELEEACNRLFQLVKSRLESPDPERAAVHCDRCESSLCCRKYNVLTTSGDLERLANGLGQTVSQLVDKHTVAAVDWSGDYKRQLACDEDEDGDEKCVFLEPDDTGIYRCTVYEHRPEICREFDMRTCDDFVPVDEVSLIE